MGARKKIAIVIGDSPNVDLLSGLAFLKNEFDVTCFAFAHLDLQNYIDSFNIMTFLPVESKPGFIPYLEKMLAEFDLIIAFETFQICTFQASRLAKKQQIPFYVISSEWQPFSFLGYRNVQAIHHDVINHADRLIVTSSLTANYLTMVGVDKANIHFLPVNINQRKFNFSVKKREKFRNYIKVADDDVVILFQGKLEQYNQPELAIKAFSHLFKENKLLAEHCKLIMVGDGSEASALKELAYHTGVGSSIYFLHQDSNPFLQDLYCASDLMIVTKTRGDDIFSSLPFSMLNAMACGVVPVVFDQTIAADWSHDCGLTVEHDAFNLVATAVMKTIAQSESLLRARNKVLKFITQQRGVMMDHQSLKKDIKETLDVQQKPFDLEVEESRGCEDGLDEAIKQYKFQETFDLAREKVKNKNLTLSEQSHYLRIMGEALTGLERYNEANSVLLQAVEIDESNWKAYKALGFIAWQIHSNQESMIFFKKALELIAFDPELFFGLGLVHQRVGMTEEALRWLEKSIYAKDDSDAALMAFMQVCHECSQTSLAIDAIKRVIDTIGDRKVLMMGLGQLQIKAGNSEEGNEILLRALEA